MGLEEFGKPLEDSRGLGMIVFSADEETYIQRVAQLERGATGVQLFCTRLSHVF